MALSTEVAPGAVKRSLTSRVPGRDISDQPDLVDDGVHLDSVGAVIPRPAQRRLDAVFHPRCADLSVSPYSRTPACKQSSSRLRNPPLRWRLRRRCRVRGRRAVMRLAIDADDADDRLVRHAAGDHPLDSRFAGERTGPVPLRAIHFAMGTIERGDGPCRPLSPVLGGEH